jgi:DNA-directed RNA polymerase II subunit RPB2
VCPAETPEGHACGIVKNMSLSCHISLSFQSEVFEEIFKALGVGEEGEVVVFLNGKLIGRHEVTMKFIETLREFKRSGKMNYDTSIVFDDEMKEIKINTDAGRCCRPLLRVVKWRIVINSRRFKQRMERLDRGRKDRVFGCI